MSVATQAMPQPPALDGDATMVDGKGPEGPNGVPKEPKFASGLILPPPEIKCVWILFLHNCGALPANMILVLAPCSRH